MVLNGHHNLCVLNEFSCIIEKRGFFSYPFLQGFALFSFSCFTGILWELLLWEVCVWEGGGGGRRVTAIPKISSGGLGGANVHLQNKHWGGGVGANVHTKNNLGGGGSRCPGRIFNWGGGEQCPFILFFIGGQMSWGANVRRPYGPFVNLVLLVC